MCDCNAFELEDDPDDQPDFTVVEQSSGGITWTYDQLGNSSRGQFGYLNEDHDFVSLVGMEYADAGPDVLRELVVPEEDIIYVLGGQGIYTFTPEDLDVPGLSIQSGQGIVAFDPVADFIFQDGPLISDMDVLGTDVWWITADRDVYTMPRATPQGTPTLRFNVADIWPILIPDSKDMLLAVGFGRVWITMRQQNPTVVAFGFDGDEIETIEVESASSEVPSDMVVERETGVLVMSGHTSGD